MRARVRVYPRREVLDPQGKAVLEALKRVGFPGVKQVRAGKSFDLELEAADEDRAGELAREMCTRLLANTVVEEFEIEVVGERG
jgi:phosphoribosylformylglycinamidine synthase